VAPPSENTARLFTLYKIDLTKLPRPTQPGHPSVGRHNEYWWVLPDSRPCYQDYWHTGLVGIKASQLSDRLGSFARLIGSKHHKGDKLPRKGPCCLECMNNG